MLAIAGSAVFCVTLAAVLAAGQGGQKAKATAVKGNAAKGKESFEACLMCHNVDSPEKKMGPSLQGLFKRKTLQNGKAVNDANILAQINTGGNGMPAYADTLSADEKANILAYLHTL